MATKKTAAKTPRGGTKAKEVKTSAPLSGVEPKTAKNSSKKKSAVKAEVKVKVPKAPVKPASSMEELLRNTGYALKAPKRGDVIKGLVTEVTRRMVLVDIGAKTEGVVLDKEIEVAKDLVEALKIGDEIEVFVKNPENDQGQILLSLRQAAEDRRWETFTEWLETKKTVEVKGVEVNKGGLIAIIDGIRGFVPSSQFSQGYLGNMDTLIDKSFKVVVIEVDREQNRLIFSEKAVSESEEAGKKSEAIKSVKINDQLDGVVSGIMPFGVFVTTSVKIDDKEAGKLEGLIHISELSWQKVDDPNMMYKVGDRVKVQVIGVEEDTGKLNLSIKRLLNDPWKDIEKRYAEGTQHEGVVIKLAAYGVFLNFEPGIDGLIHISKMPAGREFKVGEKVTVYVEMIDITHRRMSLGVVLTEAPVGYK